MSKHDNEGVFIYNAAQEDCAFQKHAMTFEVTSRKQTFFFPFT